MKLLILTAFCGVFTAQAQAPCCRVTSVDAPARIATGEVTTGGGEFAFRVDDSKLLAGLKTGQAVWANFTAKRVSLDGRSACCAITRVGPAGAVRAPLLSSVAATRPIAAAGCRHAWLPQYGGVICKGSDPSRPVILLVHGLHQSVESWTKPSSTGYTYDFRHTPVDVDLGDHAAPNAGLYKAGASDKLDVHDRIPVRVERGRDERDLVACLRRGIRRRDLHGGHAGGPLGPRRRDEGLQQDCGDDGAAANG